MGRGSHGSAGVHAGRVINKRARMRASRVTNVGARFIAPCFIIYTTGGDAGAPMAGAPMAGAPISLLSANGYFTENCGECFVKSQLRTRIAPEIKKF